MASPSAGSVSDGAAATSPPAAPREFLSFNPKISPSPGPTEGHVSDEVNGKDPRFRYTWTIWEQVQDNDPKAAYSDATHKVLNFSTARQFWRYWNHVPQPSELLEGKKYIRESDSGRNVVDALMVFRDGIKPEWEDTVNATGGHFQFQLKNALGGGAIDEYWNNIVLGIVGGTIQPAELITGVRLVDKMSQARQASVRIEVWFSNYENTEQIDLLQKSLEACMATGLDGTVQPGTPWGRTDRKNHSSTKR